MRWKIDDAAGHAIRVGQRGQGPEIVWIHGLGARAQAFDGIVPRLDGFAHTLIDLPGYGDAPVPPGAPDSLEQLADRLGAWLIARGRPAVVGHSMGGVLATLLAERGAARAIVNVDGNLTPGDCTFSGKIAAQPRADFLAHGHAALCDALVGDATTRDYGLMMRVASPAHLHRHALDLVAISATQTLAARHAALAIPALFIAGVPDGVCAESRAQLDHHRARWVGLTPAGHDVHVDQPEAFASAVAALLA